MAPPAEQDGADAPAVLRRGGGRRQLWAAVPCFGGRRRGEEAPAVAGTSSRPSSLRRRKRTVPVDGEELMVARATDEEVAGKGARLRGCCFLPPARAPELRHGTMDSSSSIQSKQRQPRSSEDVKNPPPQAPSASARQLEATASNGGGRSRSRRAMQPRAAHTAPTVTREPTRTPPLAAPRDAARTGANDAPARGSWAEKKASAAAGHGEKAAGALGLGGPVAGLTAAAAVSMAGLLGGRLCAVACVCAWLVALSRRYRREAPAAGGNAAGTGGGEEEAVADVDSTGYKKLVVLRGLLERDGTKAVTA